MCGGGGRGGNSQNLVADIPDYSIYFGILNKLFNLFLPWLLCP